MLSDTIKAFLLQIVSGDRTPKQKVKLKVTEEKLLKLMLKYNGGKARAEVWQLSSFTVFVLLLDLIFLLLLFRLSLKALCSCKIY